MWTRRIRFAVAGSIVQSVGAYSDADRDPHRVSSPQPDAGCDRHVVTRTHGSPDREAHRPSYRPSDATSDRKAHTPPDGAPDGQADHEAHPDADAAPEQTRPAWLAHK